VSKPPAQTLTPLSPRAVMASAIAGLLLGRIVMGLSVRHEGSAGGLVVALVFLVSGAASVTLFLNHMHQQRRGSDVPAPTVTWLMTLAAGVLAAIHFDGVLG
jgi:hypothetical protein